MPLKLVPTQLIPLAREHVLLEARSEMTVMALNHANACAHLHSQRMYFHISTTQRYIDVNAAQLSAAVELL